MFLDTGAETRTPQQIPVDPYSVERTEQRVTFGVSLVQLDRAVRPDDGGFGLFMVLFIPYFFSGSRESDWRYADG